MEQTVQNVVLIGAGNLATQLGKALRKNKFRVLQVYSRTQESAEKLAALLACEATHHLDALHADAQVYIFAVKDAALSTLIPEVVAKNPEALFLHTAGSVPMQVFEGIASRYGVFYPMQTFSKTVEVDFSAISCFVEGSSPEVTALLFKFAGRLSRQVYELSTPQRRYLHLAAVFASNFTNHMYVLADEILHSQGIPFQVMYPLIEETARKIRHLPPLQAQTGPAVRYDHTIIEAQTSLLKENLLVCELYELISTSIHAHAIHSTT